MLVVLSTLLNRMPRCDFNIEAGQPSTPSTAPSLVDIDANRSMHFKVPNRCLSVRKRIDRQTIMIDHQWYHSNASKVARCKKSVRKCICTCT